MKTLTDLLQLQAKAMEKYNKDSIFGQVFFSFSGHVNRMDVRYYPLGWDKKDDALEHQFTTYVNEEGIQAMYWWLRVNLELI